MHFLKFPGYHAQQTKLVYEATMEKKKAKGNKLIVLKTLYKFFLCVEKNLFKKKNK